MGATKALGGRQMLEYTNVQLLFKIQWLLPGERMLDWNNGEQWKRTLNLASSNPSLLNRCAYLLAHLKQLWSGN